MKIIWILNHYAIPPELGAGIRHYKIAENLINSGHHVKIFAASTVHNTTLNLITDKKKFIYRDFNGIPFIFIRACDYSGNGKKRIKNMLEYSIGLLSVAQRFDGERPDIIYASSVHPLAWVAGFILARRYNAKFIAETRDLWPETLIAMGRIKSKSLSAKLLYKLESYIYKKADKLIFTIPGGKDYIESKGLDTSKVIYLNNGIDLGEFDTNKSIYQYVDEALDDNSIFKVVYTGSMGIANSIDYLVQAARYIQEQGISDIKFILFGDGYIRKELEEYVDSHKLSNIFFKGAVEKKYIPNILSKSDLNIFTGQNINLYRYGLSLNKMFEYFASAKPTLSNIECGYDIIRDFNCGMTVKGGSSEALAEGIIKFYRMPQEEYNSYCNNAYEAAKEFDFKKLTDRLDNALENI